MTGLEVAQWFRAKKTARDKWIALCPSHPDRKPSLQISEGKKCVLIKCMSVGCDLRDIVTAVGLTVEQLFYDSGRRVDSSLAREWAAKKLSDELYAREQRTESLKTWEASVLSKPPIRTQTKFEQDIERFCNSLEAR